jgi:hypothetical protein
MQTKESTIFFERNGKRVAVIFIRREKGLNKKQHDPKKNRVQKTKTKTNSGNYRIATSTKIQLKESTINPSPLVKTEHGFRKGGNRNEFPKSILKLTLLMLSPRRHT